jgi:chaperone modulatory protein CbpM
MKLEQADVMWLDAECECSIVELQRLSGLSEAELRELVDYGAFAPINPQEREWAFSGEVVYAAKTAGRLRNDMDLDAQALALALTLIKRIRDLEAQISDLRAQLPHRVR